MKRIHGFILTGVILFLASFVAFAQDSHPLRPVVIYGDTRTNNAEHSKVVSAIIKINPSVVFHVGDLVNNGRNKGEWETFNAITAGLRNSAEFFPVIGNHEYDSELYFKNFHLPGNGRWYRVDRGGINFIVLDSEVDMSKLSAQYRWLEKELISIQKEERPIIVIFHHPVFSLGRDLLNNMSMSDFPLPLFEKYGVSAVFSGHEHNYERFFYRNIYYIVTGGGGAPLYDKVKENPFNQKFIKAYHFCALNLSGNEITVTVYNTALEPIDSFTIKKVVRN